MKHQGLSSDSLFAQSLHRRRKLALLVLPALLAALSNSTLQTQAASAPPTTLMHITENNAPVHGGVATIGTDGIYYSIFSTSSTRAKVVKLSATATHPSSPLWTFTAPGVGSAYDMYAIPALDAAGARLYIGSDFGIFYCLNTTDGSIAWSYTVTSGADKRIRSGAALDPNNPLGPTVYFHCNDGLLYALNANNGALLWTAATGNAGGPPVHPDYPAVQPASSSPVVAFSGTVYVGSADGAVYSFNPVTGQQNWRVVLNTVNVEPVEATLAIGQDGTLYAATRINPAASIGGNVYAINPVTQAKLWTFYGQVSGLGLGFVASPVIDQSGFIYAPVFGRALYKLHPADGGLVHDWTLYGKLCQTPSINQNGLLIIGISKFQTDELNAIAAIRIGDPTSDLPYWQITQVGGQDLGNTTGSPAIRCTSDGRTYVADMAGKVFRFDSGAMMMAGTWPTFQCGNRRAGKSATYSAAIAELPPFYLGTSSLSRVNQVDVFSRSVGVANGHFSINCAYSASPGNAAAVWKGTTIGLPGGCTLYVSSYMANTVATGLNGAGDVCGYYPTGHPVYGPFQPVAWADGVDANVIFSYLGLAGYSSGYASAINANGTIVGYTTAGVVLRWTKTGSTWGAPVNLGAPPGNLAYAYAITDNGWIAGQGRFTVGGPLHAFITQAPPNNLATEAIDLGTMGGTSSEARHIHEAKATVGRSQIVSGYWRAFYLPIDCTTLGGTAVYQIPVLPGVTRTDWSSTAYSVNKLGKAVGYTQNQSLANRAFLYDSSTGITADLNTYPLDGGQTPASLGWALTSAASINDLGVMVGYGTISGRSTCWIIYPKCQD